MWSYTGQKQFLFSTRKEGETEEKKGALSDHLRYKKNAKIYQDCHRYVLPIKPLVHSLFKIQRLISDKKEQH